MAFEKVYASLESLIVSAGLNLSQVTEVNELLTPLTSQDMLTDLLDKGCLKLGNII